MISCAINLNSGRASSSPMIKIFYGGLTVSQLVLRYLTGAVCFMFCHTSLAVEEVTPEKNKNFLFKDIESKLSGGVRAYPKGGRLLYKAKKEYVLWGEKEVNGKKNHMYGYAAPNATAYTAGYLNGARFDVDIFPISFFGFRFGHEIYFNNKEYSAFDCETFNCKGGFDKSYYEILGAMKCKKVFYKMRLIRQNVTQRNIYKPNFMDALTGLVAKNDGDNLLVDHHVTGYLFSKQWVVSVLYINARAQEVNNDSEQITLNVTHFKDDKWTYNFGLGSFRSTTRVRKATALILAEYKL